MVNRKKAACILTAVLLFVAFNLLFLNGCSNNNTSGESEAAIEKDQDIDIGKEEEPEADSAGSEAGSEESQTSEDSSQETVNKEDEDNDQEGEAEESSQASSTYSDEEGNTIKDIYQRFIDSGRPSIIVFSYDEDCCPGTKAFFEEYNDSAMKLLRSYAGSFNALYINIGDLSENNMNTVVEIASKNSVLNLPSILILDKSGNAYKVIEGPFDETEVKKILGGMIDDRT